jgi:hypothetical protein
MIRTDPAWLKTPDAETLRPGALTHTRIVNEVPLPF